MSRLTINPGSDDLVSYQWEGEGEECGTPEMDFKVTLPDGSTIPIKTTYGNWGWEFQVELPEGSKVEHSIPPEYDDNI